jgi:glycine cleavage system H lipoate-binding protein
MISATENSNKFQKTKFWKEKSVEDVVTLGPTTHATLSIDELVQMKGMSNCHKLHFVKE